MKSGGISTDRKRNANRGQLVDGVAWKMRHRSVPHRDANTADYDGAPQDGGAVELSAQLAAAHAAGTAFELATPKPVEMTAVTVPAHTVWRCDRSWKWDKRPPVWIYDDPAVVVEAIDTPEKTAEVITEWFVSWADDWYEVDVPERRYSIPTAMVVTPNGDGTATVRADWTDLELDAADAAEATAEVEAWRQSRKGEGRRERVKRPRKVIPSAGRRMVLGGYRRR